MRISDWSSDVCSSGLIPSAAIIGKAGKRFEYIEITRIAAVIGFHPPDAEQDVTRYAKAALIGHQIGLQLGVASPAPADTDRIEPPFQVITQQRRRAGAIVVRLVAEIGRATGRERVCRYV